MSVAAAAVAVFGVAGIVAAPSTAGRARRRLSAMAPRVGPIRSRQWVVAAAVLVLVLTWAAGVRLTVMFCVAGVIGWIALTGVQRRRRLKATRAAVVEMCRAIAAELRSGQPAGRALATGGQLIPAHAQTALTGCFAAAAQGVEGEPAELLMIAARAEAGLAGLSRLAACWQVAASAGSALAPALDRIADGLQDEIDVRLDLDTALAGPRATVRLLAGLPAIGLLLGTVVGADPLAFLFGSPLGIGCLICALVLDLAGIGWARRIAGSASGA